MEGASKKVQDADHSQGSCQLRRWELLRGIQWARTPRGADRYQSAIQTPLCRPWAGLDQRLKSFGAGPKLVGRVERMGRPGGEVYGTCMPFPLVGDRPARPFLPQALLRGRQRAEARQTASQQSNYLRVRSLRLLLLPDGTKVGARREVSGARCQIQFSGLKSDSRCLCSRFGTRHGLGASTMCWVLSCISSGVCIDCCPSFAPSPRVMTGA